MGEVPDEIPDELRNRLDDALEADGRLRAAWNGEPPRGADQTRSAYDLKLGGAMRRHGGFSSSDFATAARHWPFGKGTDGDYRHWQRTWQQAAPPPPPPEPEPDPVAGQADLDQELAHLDASDTDNGQRLIRRYGHDLRWSPHGGWLRWDGCRWQRDDARGSVGLAQLTAKAIFSECRYLGDDAPKRARWAYQSKGAARVHAMLDMGAPHLAVAPAQMDIDPWLLTVENGTLDLRTGQLGPHRRRHLITKLAPVVYDEAATAPRWMQFLDEIFESDADLIAYIQRIAGYCLTGSTREHLMLILWGVGQNGKTTFLKVIRKVLGDYAQQTPTDTFMARDRNNQIPNDIARLAGARFVSATETDRDRRLAEPLIKQATGGDPMTGRFLHQEFFEFQPAFKLWLATNYRPEVRGTDEGIWRRLRLIPFKVQFMDQDKAEPGQRVKDGRLEDTLLTELPGVLAWAVRGCLDWQNEGLITPEKVRVETDAYRADMDQLGDFLDECCDFATAYSAKASDLWGAYKKHCAAKDTEPKSNTWFGLRLVERGYRKEKVGTVTYRGLALRDEWKPKP